MPGGQEDSTRRGNDASRSALDFIHGLLVRPPAAGTGLDGLLASLAAAFGASEAGLAILPSAKVLLRHPAGDGRLPWQDNADLTGRVLRAATGVVVARPEDSAKGGSWLVSAVRLPARPGWLLWLEADSRRPAWTAAEAAALTLAGQALSGWLETDGAKTRLADQLERGERQQGLETAARVAARLAHDFGNVLTGIVGFCDLSLALKAPAESQIGRYLRELQRCAQNGAQLTHLLRLFSRRQAGGVNPCDVGAVVAEESARLTAPGGPFTVRAEIAPGLPPAAIDAGQLRQILGILIENARDAMQAAGAVQASVRTVNLTTDDCLGLYGDAQAGAYVEIAVADAGPGLSAEDGARLFAEPFFTAKPRHRGFGLAVAYGILHAHHAGIRLRRGASGGAVAEVYVPAVGPTQMTPAEAAPAARAERMLVVDDDANILRFICATLERAGYQVQGVASADDALARYTASPGGFGLVLTDVVMPGATGVDLARRLLQHDPNVRVLFMSGHAGGDFLAPDIAGRRFEVLPKPFRPESLLRAVRGAIERAQTGTRGQEAGARSQGSDVKALR